MRTREIKIRIPDDDLIEKKFRYLASKYEIEHRAGKLFDYWEKDRFNRLEAIAAKVDDGERMVRWKQIAGSIYEVSEDGRVRNFITGHECKQHKYGCGYLKCYLDCYIGGRYCKWKYVHRLVAEAFIPNPDNLPEVNHKDINKYNNDVSNLEWVSRLDNRKWNYKRVAKEKGYHIDINVGWGGTKNG